MASIRLDRLEWQYRYQAATMRADRLRRDADLLGDELARLSQCETDHETVLKSIQNLLEEVLLAQQLAMDFDCAALHEAEDPGRPPR